MRQDPATVVCGAEFQQVGAPGDPILRVEKLGEGTGTVTSNPAGIDCDAGCGSQQASFAPGDIDLTALATPEDSTFGGWGGACEHFTSESGTLSLVDGVTTCTVGFEPAGSNTRTLQVVVGDGRVYGIDLDCPGDCSEAYTYDSMVTITAEDSGGVFSHWEGTGCDPVAGNPKQAKVHMTTLRECTAYFSDLVHHQLRVVKDGTGLGWIDSIDASPVISCREGCSSDTAFYVEGTDVQLYATPVGSGFEGWSGAGCTTPPNQQLVTVSMTQDRVCTARFVPEDAFTLHLTVASDGGTTEVPTVTVQPGGLVCADDCTEGFPQNGTVTLTAFGDGLEFHGWYGDDGCLGNTSPLQLVMDNHKTCSAEFRCIGWPTCEEDPVP